MIWRIAGAIIALVLLYAAGEVAWRSMQHALAPHTAQQTASQASAPIPDGPIVPRPPTPAMALRTTLPAVPAVIPPETSSPCVDAPKFAAAAVQNTLSLQTAAWAVFGRPETGWEIYAPLVEHEIATACPPTLAGFAGALAAWQGGAALPPDGIMDATTLKAMNIKWLRRRPFVAANAHGACPAPPDPSRLVWMDKDEGYSGKAVQLRPGTLAAWRAMVTAARAEEPAIAADHRLLTVFSGYRDPVSDAARCAEQGNCGTITKANCSAHRTGLAMDMYLGSAPGYPPESSADPNRLYQSRTAAYHWLAANAARFGFAPYPFEPWHWEWTGEPI